MWKRKRRRDMADVNIYTAERLSEMARSLGVLARACNDRMEEERGLTREDALAAMQTAAAVVCGQCSRCNLYSDADKDGSYYLYYLLRSFEQKGRVEYEDMPRLFLETCRNKEAYLTQLNRNLGRATMNLEWKNRFLESREVEERCGVRVEGLQKKPAGYELTTGAGTVFAKKLILAAGGRAMPSSGSDGSGLALAASLGLKAAKPFPSLTPVRVDSPVLKAVKGMRCRCKASLLADKKLVKQETGEIQFTEQGLSGICVFNLSRLAGEFFSQGTVNGQKAGKIVLSLDLVPELEFQKLLDFLGALAADQPRLPLEQLLGGVLNKRVGLALLKQMGFVSLSRPIGDLSPAALKNICHTVKDWRFTPTGTLGWQQAQATAGGLLASQFEPSTLEAKRLPGLYACGELLDVDGDCGGYNLQWAWSSGFTAGKSAARALESEARK